MGYFPYRALNASLGEPRLIQAPTSILGSWSLAQAGPGGDRSRGTLCRTSIPSESSPRSQDPHSPAPPRPSIIAVQPVMCLPGSQISPARRYYPVSAPWIRTGSLTSSSLPRRRESGPLRVPPRSVQAERILRLPAFGLPLLALLLVLLLPVRAQNPDAKVVSMGVVSWGPPATGITQNL